VVFIPLIYVTPWPTIQDGAEKVTTSTIVPIGNLLLSKYLLPFEIASLLLLIALIGAVVIARGEVKLKEVEDEKSKQS
jgi:NADH:ubiquinone oxidoreductase subunit 6 (subunit J)